VDGVRVGVEAYPGKYVLPRGILVVAENYRHVVAHSFVRFPDDYILYRREIIHRDMKYPKIAREREDRPRRKNTFFSNGKAHIINNK
jgi:hypothetical protein